MRSSQTRLVYKIRAAPPFQPVVGTVSQHHGQRRRHHSLTREAHTKRKHWKCQKLFIV